MRVAPIDMLVVAPYIRGGRVHHLAFAVLCGAEPGHLLPRNPITIDIPPGAANNALPQTRSVRALALPSTRTQHLRQVLEKPISAFSSDMRRRVACASMKTYT